MDINTVVEFVGGPRHGEEVTIKESAFPLACEGGSYRLEQAPVLGAILPGQEFPISHLDKGIWEPSAD